mgnify:CR=1 FL=1
MLEESSDAEELFTLSPEQAGQKFGELVKGVSEAVMSVGDDFQRGLDNVQRQDAQPEEQPGVEESSGQTDLPVSENPGEDQPEVPNKEQSLSPQQLGEMLGVFIRDMNAALKDAEQGFEAGMQSEAPGNTEATAAAEKAGKALGDFVNAFNSALGEQTKAAGNSEEAN